MEIAIGLFLKAFRLHNSKILIDFASTGSPFIKRMRSSTRDATL